MAVSREYNIKVIYGFVCYGINYEGGKNYKISKMSMDKILKSVPEWYYHNINNKSIGDNK